MAQINQLCSVTTPSASDLLPLFSQQNGDARNISIANLAVFLQTLLTAATNLIKQYAAPLTGATVQINNANNDVWLIITPAGTIANLTLALPLQGTAIDMQEIIINTTQTITALAWSIPTGVSLVGAPTTLAQNAHFRLKFDGVTQTWYTI